MPPAESRRAADLQLECPRCKIPMELTSLDWGAGFLACLRCHGCFVPPGDWAVMLDHVRGIGAVPGDELVARADGPSGTELSHSVSCPECAATMTRTAYGSDVSLPVDVCIMHGIWFDARELAEALRATEREEDVPALPQPAPTRTPVAGALPLEAGSLGSRFGRLPTIPREGDDEGTSVLVQMVDAFLDLLRPRR